MGDRYTITASPEDLETRFKVDVTKRYQPRYNAAPTQVLPIITQASTGLSFFYWGQIPDRSKNRSISTKLIHIDAETLKEKLSSRKALMSNRCLIPIDGYYDWKRISKKGRVPHRIIFSDNKIHAAAGIWEEFEDDQEQLVHTFRMITTPANSMIAPINGRMPAILSLEGEKLWLSEDTPEEELLQLLTPYPAEKMGSYTVSPRIDDLKNDTPSLLQPVAPADQFGNYSLFD